MAFVAPLIGTLIGGVAATALGQAVIGIGLSIGASYLAKRLKPKSDTSARGMSLSLRTETNESREVILGQAATAGSLKYHNAYGPNGNDYIQLLYVLADHECDLLQAVYVDGKLVTLGSVVSGGEANGTTVTEYPGVMWISFKSGAWDQSADADLVAKNGTWSSNNRGRGVCYVRVTLKYDAAKYPNGIPSFLFVVRGAKLYDWRKDSTNGGSGSHRWGTPSTYEWSANVAVCAYNWCRGIYVNGERLAGMNAPAASCPVGEWTAAANACDEDVTLKAGGTEKRYRMGAVIPVNSENGAVLREIVTAFGGVLADSGGVYKPLPGVSRSSVMSIVDTDLCADEAVEYVPKVSRSQLVNAVFGTHPDPAQLYQATALPPRISPSDQEADGDVLLDENYNLAFVTSATQAQRIMEIFRRKGRHQRTVTCKLRSKFAVLESGDWVTWTSGRFGFESLTFEVIRAVLNQDLTVNVELKETSSSIFGWIANDDELDPDDPGEVSAGGASFTTVAGIDLDAVTVPGAGDEQRPALQIEWTPITDATVVSLKLEYRIIGDTVAIERNILDPGAGNYTWLDGVQGGVTYEARLKPVTQPERGTVWSAWVSSASEAPPQVVSQAALALSVPPDTVTPEMLSEQARRELALVTASSAVANSVEARLEEALRQAQEAASAALGALAENTILLRAVRATAGANAIAITETLAAVGGAQALAARWAVAIDLNGNVIGLTELSGNLDYSQFSVIADKFAYAYPGINGGAPVPIFSIGVVEGDTVAYFNGELIANAIRANQVTVNSLDALSVNAGLIIAGRFQNPANTSYFDLDTGDFQIG